MSRMAGRLAPALLVAVALLVHGTTPHGHRAGAAVVSIQAWQAGHADGVPGGQAPDRCPQPFDGCDAGLRNAEAPMSSAGVPLPYRVVAGPSGDGALLALTVNGHGPSTIRPDRWGQDAPLLEPALSQVCRC
jgi:hypothetical protein